MGMILTHAITSDATRVRVTSLDPLICPALDGAHHARLEIYTAAGKEVVVATECNGTELTVARGYSETEARDWPACACVKLLEIVDQPLCESEEGGCCECFDGVTVGTGLVVTRPDPCALHFELAPTGVAAGAYCGMTVNAFGQITSLDPNFPASCLPVFNPCGPCDEGGTGGGATDASQITYTAIAGAPFALGPSVQDAIRQLEVGLAAIPPPSGVETATAGDGIVIGGTSTDITVSLSPSGVSPGTYAGFTVDQYGRVTNYVAVGGGGGTVTLPNYADTAPINISYNAGTNTYTWSIDDASIGTKGVVQLANPTQVTAGTAAADDVITYQSLALIKSSLQTEIAVERARIDQIDLDINSMNTHIGDIEAITITGVDGVTGGGDLSANRTLRLDFDNLPGHTILDPIDLAQDKLAYWDESASLHKSIKLQELADMIGAPRAAALCTSTGTIVAHRNVASVSPGAAGVYTVTLASPMPSVNYIVNAMAHDAAPGVRSTVDGVLVVIQSATVFTLHFTNGNGLGTPVRFSFQVCAL
jgi:hypothetical protein